MFSLCIGMYVYATSPLCQHCVCNLLNDGYYSTQHNIDARSCMHKQLLSYSNTCTYAVHTYIALPLLMNTISDIGAESYIDECMIVK